MPRNVVISITNSERSFPGNSSLLGSVYEDFGYLARSPCDLKINHVLFTALNKNGNPIRILAYLHSQKDNGDGQSGEIEFISVNERRGLELTLSKGERIVLKCVDNERTTLLHCMSPSDAVYFQLLLFGKIIEEED